MEHSPSGESDSESAIGRSALGAAIRLPLVVSVLRVHPLARLLCRGDVTALTLGADGRLTVEQGDGSRHEAVVDASTTVFSRLVILRYRCGGRRESLVLPHVAMDADAHRRLRVWLATQARFNAAV